MAYFFRQIIAAVLSVIMSLTGFVSKPSKPMAEFYVSVDGSDSHAGTNKYFDAYAKLFY